MPSTDTMPLLLLGGSAAAARLRADVAGAVDADRVLIVADAGLEVERLAAYLHAEARGTGDFVAVDCSAAEPVDVERDLFGSGGRASDLEAIDRSSAVSRANDGTLFLTGLSDLSPSAQARLARLARDREALIDAARTRINIRFVVTVSPDAEADPAQARLDGDMVRRFSTTRIEVAPLRQRSDDLPLLIDQLVRRTCVDAMVDERPAVPEALRVLSAMPWRDNLRELRNAVERLVKASNTPTITLEEVLLQVQFDASLQPQAPVGSLRAARQQFERDYVTLVLRHHQWRMSDAARTLGIQRTNLYRKARQLGIPVTRSGARP